MKGLEIARVYWSEQVQPLLAAEFSDLLPLIAAGLCGGGSECYGYDDEISRDHDFAPDVGIYLPSEAVVDRREAFRLERALSKLPREFMGLRRQYVGPVGGPRRGVLRTADFFLEKTGSADGCLRIEDWLRLSDATLAEAVNGEVFFDGYGEFTAIRRRIAAYPPDVRKKKLAGHLLLMAQAGQYNFARCLAHGEEAAAQWAVIEFARHASAVAFLLNGVYEPYYKWRFRTMRSLPRLPFFAELLEYLITTGCDPALAAEKQAVMESLCADVIAELRKQSLTRADCADLEKHAHSVNDGIADSRIRNLHILCAV